MPKTLQTVFNIVSTHLLTQGMKSRNAFGTCAYRGENGMKCAAGALIPDDQYKPEIENVLWTDLVSEKIVSRRFVNEIAELQQIHDLGDSDPEECVAGWKKKLIKFAKKNML